MELSSESPAPSPTSSSVSVPTSSHPNSETDVESTAVAPSTTDDRPHAPVAKTLNKQEQKHSSPTAELIPNLLHSGKFPPPPRSPARQHTHSMSISPPPILMNHLSPTPLAAADALGSPSYVPACPPGTPYTPYTKAAEGTLPSHLLSTSPTLPSSQYKLGIRSSPPPMSPPFPPSDLPPTTTSDHYTTLLNQHQSKAIAQEKERVESLLQHEKSFTTLDEYRHALARERRHSLSLVQELSHYKFLYKYQSCTLYSEAEINEEAKVNLLIKNMEGIIKSKDEEKCKTVMELEREEERMINVLMERLEAVKREKGMLERQIYGCGVNSAAGRFESMEGVEREVRPLGQEMQDAKPAGQSARQSEAPSNEIEECEEEADGDQDILGDRFHDPEMEMELDSLLEKKGVDK